MTGSYASEAIEDKAACWLYASVTNGQGRSYQVRFVPFNRGSRCDRPMRSRHGKVVQPNHPPCTGGIGPLDASEGRIYGGRIVGRKSLP